MGDPKGPTFLHLRVYPCLYNPIQGLEQMKVGDFEANDLACPTSNQGDVGSSPAQGKYQVFRMGVSKGKNAR